MEHEAINSPKLKSILKLKDQPIIQADWPALALDYVDSPTMSEVLLALIDDYQSGHLTFFRNPSIRVVPAEIMLSEYKSPICCEHLTNLSMDYGREHFEQKLGELREAVRRGTIVPRSIRLGENWTGKYDLDVILFLHCPNSREQPSQILVTPRTRTEQITPFVDASIVRGDLLVGSRDKSAYRIEVYEPRTKGTA